MNISFTALARIHTPIQFHAVFFEENASVDDDDFAVLAMNCSGELAALKSTLTAQTASLFRAMNRRLRGSRATL